MKKLIFLVSLFFIVITGYSQQEIRNGLHIIVSDLSTVVDTTFTVFIPENHVWQSVVVWDSLTATDGEIQHQTSIDGVHYSNYYGESAKVMVSDSSHYAFEDDRFTAFDLRLKLTKGSNTKWWMDWYIILKPR
ncbi:hypothetical protein ES704_03663 [subsurface metagenome]|jgi:hypothetical protein